MARTVTPNPASWVALSLLAPTALTGCGGSEPDRPNVVLIVVDTLRKDHLGCYGYEKLTSPAIDRLAADALRFECAISSAPWTTPSIAALMTSQHPATLGIRGRRSILGEEQLLLAEVLRGAGWATGAAISHDFCSREWGFAQGFDAFDESGIQSYDSVVSELVSDAGRAFIEQHAGEPFFLWLHYFDPHFAYLEHDGHDFSDGREYGGVLTSQTDLTTLNWGRKRVKADDLAELLSFYDSEIGFTDRQIARVLDRLRELGLYEDAIVVFTADHGEEFLDHGRFGHSSSLYRELIEVPLLVKLPGEEPGVVGGPVALLDVYPTILAAVGLEPPDGVVGRSLLPGAQGGVPEGRPIFTEALRLQPLRAVVSGPYKLVHDMQEDTHVLYDLRADPGETRDVAADLPDVAKALRRELDGWSAELEQRTREGMERDLSPAEIQRLEALGYAGGDGE